MASPLRVLLLEDRLADAELVLHELRRAGFEPEWHRVDTRADYLASLDQAWDVILADYSLPQFDAPEALRIVRERGLPTPFIMISGTVGEEQAIECIKQGAADYLLKDRLARLGPAISKVLADRRLAQEKLQAEAALRESEERHRLLFDNASLGIGYFTPTGQIIAFNQVAAAFMGDNPEDFVGKTLLELYGKEIGSIYQTRIEFALKQGTNQVYEDLVVLPTGLEKWFLSTYSRIVDASGEIVGIQIISTDITEHKRSEAALHESERFARSILDGLSAHIAILDESGTILAVNQRWRTFATKNPPVTGNVCEGANYLAVCDQATGDHSEEAAAFAAGIRAVLAATQFSFELEYACHSPSEQRWYIGRVTRFPGDGPRRVVVAHENVTRQKLAELKRLEEHALLRTLVDHLPDIIYAKDRQGRFTLVNRAHAQQIGVTSPDEALGKTDADFYPPAMAARFEIDDQSVMQTGKSLLNREETFGAPDGAEGWQLTSKVPLHDNQGHVTGLVGIGHDITQRKAAENALQASETAEREQRILAETLQNTAAALNSALDLDTVMQVILENIALIVSHQAANIMLIDGDQARVINRRGYPPEIMPLLENMHIPLSSTSHLQHVLATRAPHLISHTDREPTWVGLPHTDWVKSYVAAPIKLHENVIGFINVDSGIPGFFTQDHAQRLQAFADQASIVIERVELYEEIRRHAADLEARVEERTAQLNHAKERIEAILNSSDDVIILCQTNGSIEQANPAFLHLFGQLADEVLFQPLTQLVIAEHAARVDKAFQVVLATGQSQRLEVTAQLDQGAPVAVELTLSQVIEQNNQALGVVCVLHDVSERKRMETELRTALAREKELNELKTRFVGMISHDVRTPLAVISSSTEILRVYYNRLDEPLRAKHFKQIDAQVERMVALLNDVLTISRADSGTVLFSPTLLDLDKYCRELIEEFRHIPDMSHTLIYTPPEEPLILPADEKLLYQALTNVLNNAVRYSPEGSTIHLSLSSDAQHAILKLADNGIGILPEDLPHLFETFHRGSNVGEIRGTGLGMAIVKRSIDAHGGTVTCESQVGVGTTFTILLPKTRPAEAKK